MTDKAISLRFSLPLDASGWRVFGDADNYESVPSNGSSAIFAGSGLRQFGRLPNGISEAPLLVIADVNSDTAVMAAIPMESTVWVSRTVYNAGTKALEITFDFALTSQSFRFANLASFSFLLARVSGDDHTTTIAEPFRAGLKRFYDLHPQIYSRDNRLHDQGAWMPFINDLQAIPQVQDFGIKFQEGGGNVSESHWMNKHGVDILPYIEPGLMHWSLPKGMPPTYENLNRTVHECCAHPEKFGGHGSDVAVLCKEIVADAMVDDKGLWIFEPEDQAWNSGAV